MASIYKTAQLSINAKEAWDFIDKYTRSEVHVFANSQRERQEHIPADSPTGRPAGFYRVVTDLEGVDFWELNVGVDPEHMRAAYTVPGLFGATFHAASMQIVDTGAPGCTLIWITDVLPDSFAAELDRFYVDLFDELVAAVEGRQVTDVGHTPVPKPVPLPDPSSEGFWAATREHRLDMQRCTTCGHYLYPPDVACPRDLTENLKYVPVSGRATLYSFAIITQPFHVGFADSVPYAIAFVELPEEPGLRMITTIADTPLSSLEIGMPLEVVFEDRGEQTVPLFRAVGAQK